MIISPVKYENNNQKIAFKTKTMSNPVLPQNNVISNIFYHPTFQPSFKGLKLETSVIKKILGKEYQGLGIYTKAGNYIDYLKVGSKKLAQEPLDITKATQDEVTAYRFSLSLAESYECSWVRRYNPHNRKSPLAVSHTLNSQDVNEDVYAKNLDILSNFSRCKSLDVPITDKAGNLCLDCVVFDTETTGVKDTDKIIQWASAQVKNGKLVEDESGICNKLINPEIPIPEAASDVNGITDDMVKDAPTMNAVLKGILDKHLNKQNGVLVAYNAKFDIKKLNNAIREHNVASNVELKQKQGFKVLDPFIIIQRIHPFLGAKKKLSTQYQWLFCKEMEDAHDALADVKGTVDVLKYCLYYLSEHRKNKSVPLSLREVLAFQNGSHNVKNIDIPLHPTKNFSSKSDFKTSYRKEPLNVDNYFKGYKLTEDSLEEIAEAIGEANVAKLKNDGVVGTVVDMTYRGHRLQPAETKRIPKTGGYENAFYTMEKNMKKVLGFAKLVGNDKNGKTKEEIEELILEKSKYYIHNKNINTWIKNVNPEDIKNGNDLPDLDIARRVMAEK